MVLPLFLISMPAKCIKQELENELFHGHKLFKKNLKFVYVFEVFEDLFLELVVRFCDCKIVATLQYSYM